MGFRRAVATVIRRGRGPGPREEVATFGHVVHVDRHVSDGAILRGDLDGHIAVAPVLTVGRRGSGGSRRQVGIAVGVEVRRVVGGPDRTQARGRVIGHHHGLADHLRRAVAAIVGGRHRPRPREGEAAFGLSVSTVTSVGRSAVGVSRRDGDIAVTGVHGHGHWARRRREVREAVGIERVVRGAHRREGRDGRCGHVERGDVLRHGLDGLVAAIVRTGDGERPHEGVGPFGRTVRTVTGIDRSAVRVFDLNVHAAVAVVLGIGHRRHAGNGRARVGTAERIDVDRLVGRSLGSERRSRVVDHRHEARDLRRRGVAAVVGRGELIRAQDREGTRTRQAGILLGAVEVERRDLHVVVTVVRGTGRRVRHAIHVVGEAVRVRREGHSLRRLDREGRSLGVLEHDALHGGGHVATAVGGGVDDVISTLARRAVERDGRLGGGQLDVVAEAHVAVGLERSQRAVAGAERDVVDEQALGAGVRLEADVQLRVIESVEVEGGEVPLSLDAQTVDVLVVGVDEVDLPTVGHHPDADAVTGLPARRLREVVERERHTAHADVDIVEHHFHDAVGVLHLEALASVREGTHRTCVAGHTHEVSVSEAVAARAVVVAGEAHLTAGRREVHVRLARVAGQGVVNGSVSSIDVLVTAVSFLEARVGEHRGLVSCGEVEAEQVAGGHHVLQRRDVRSGGVGHLDGLDVGHRRGVAVVVGHRDGPSPLEGVAGRSRVARRRIGVADVHAVEVRLRSRRPSTSPVVDQEGDVARVLRLVGVVVRTTAGGGSVAVHNPAGLIPGTAVRVRIGTGTQGDAVLELVAGVGSVLSSHTEHVDDVRRAVDDGDVVITIAVDRSARASNEGRSKAVAAFEAGIVGNPGVLSRGQRADAAQVDVAARGRTGVAVGPTLQGVSRQVDVAVATVVDLHEAAAGRGIVRITDGGDDETAGRHLSGHAVGLVTGAAAVVAVIGRRATRVERGRVEVTIVIIGIDDDVSGERARDIRCNLIENGDRVARRGRGLVATIIHHGHGVRPKDVVAAHAVSNARVGGVVADRNGVGHVAVAVVRRRHQEAGRITGHRSGQRSGVAGRVEVDRLIRRSVEAHRRSRVVRDGDGLVDGLGRAVSGAVRGGHREGAGHHVAALVGGVISRAGEGVGVGGRVGHRHVAAVVAGGPAHGAHGRLAEVGRGQAPIDCHVSRSRQGEGGSRSIGYRDVLDGGGNVVATVLRIERPANRVFLGTSRRNDLILIRQVDARIAGIFRRGHFEVGRDIFRACDHRVGRD